MPRRKTTEEFIIDSGMVHGLDEYDYSLVEYIKSSIPVRIICKKHGAFLQKPSDHLNGHGCQKCGQEKLSKINTKSTIEFVSKSISLFGDLYDYSESNYINCCTDIKVFCKKHKKYFYVHPSRHLNGVGCPVCGSDRKSNSLRLSLDEFIVRSNKIHNNIYDYSKVVYVKNTVKVDIICKNHGVFKMAPANHLNGAGCQKCANELKSKNSRYSTEDFLGLAKKRHGDGRYDYSNVDYINSITKVDVICYKHGVFEATPADHLRGVGCPLCSESKGELSIRVVLENNKVDFFPQFGLCGRFKCDFYLPKLNLVLEFHGKQHYVSDDFFGGISKFLVRAKCDIIKKHYCLNNGIHFLEIPYWEKDNIEEIILNKIKEIDHSSLKA